MRAINTFFLFLLGLSVALFVVGCSSSNQVQSSQNQPMVPDQSATPTPAVEGQNGAPNPASPPSDGYNNTFDREAMRQNSIDACNGMNENDSCQLTFGNRTMTGTCRSFNDTLSCTPANPTGGRMRGSGNYTRNGNYTRYQGGGQ